MARVLSPRAVQARAERYLTYLEREWGALPSVASEWDTWDDLARLDFVVEWPIREDRLLELQRWAAEGRLTAAQQVRYAQLLRLVDEYRPVVARLVGQP